MLDHALATVNMRRFHLVVGCLITAAWCILVIWRASPYATLLDHGHTAPSTLSPLATFAIVMLSWNVMSIAMMLPAELPMLECLRRHLLHRARGNQLMVAFVLGYLAVWTLFGVLVGIMQTLLRAPVGGEGISVPSNAIAMFICWQGPLDVGVPFRETVPQSTVSGVALFVAGVYQFTPAKRRRLLHCRSPHNLLQAEQADAGGMRSMLQQGGRHGRDCIGNCWALMVCMISLGMSLELMLAFGVIMAIERASGWGNAFTRPLGLVLVVMAVASILGSVAYNR